MISRTYKHFHAHTASGASAIFALAVLLAGCANRTAIKVEVRSDFAVPAEVDLLDFSVVGASTGAMLDRSYPLAAPFPQSLSVRPASSDSEDVVITVTLRKAAASGTATFVARRVVREHFASGEDRTIVMEVPRACFGVECESGVDCVGGICGAGCTSPDDCDDGDPCNGVERCEASRCLSTGVADCDDHIACTVDGCAAKTCTHTPDDTQCSRGDHCIDGVGCGGRACSGNGECDDGNPCNGAEICTGGMCLSGSSPTCDDGDDCTADACAMPSGCGHTTRDVDGDRHGSAMCAASGGIPADDCDDSDASAFPGAPETCNGRDDDCDTACDDGFACCRGTSAACTTSCGSTGTQICGTTCTLGSCNPPAETCNGMDDDCDGECDNGVGCCAGSVLTCATACGSAGTRMCGSDCTPGPCVGPSETCNGADDDCDGTIDDGFACAGGSVTSCVTSCGSMGTRTCSATCVLGACMPPAEVCGNGVDDDCNGTADEGCTAGCTGTCTGATTIPAPGGRFNTTLSAGSRAGSCGGAGGSESVFTFTLASPSDVFLTTHGSTTDTVLYVRSCSCAGTEVACNDDADGLTSSMLQLNALAAGTYTVFVDSKAAMSAAVQLDAYISPVGTAGDRCGRPVRLTNGTTTGNTCGLASDVSAQGMCSFTASMLGPDRVYYVVIPPGASRDVIVSSCGGCTAFDNTLSLQRLCTGGGAGGTMQIMCDDSACRSSCAPSGPRRQARAESSLSPGIYYVIVDGSGTECGDYTLTTTGL